MQQMVANHSLLKDNLARCHKVLESVTSGQDTEAIQSYVDGDYTCLMMAVAWGDKALLKRALACGAVVDYPSFREGYTALHLACRYGKQACVTWLLQHGANINSRSYCGMTPLMMAAQYADTELVDYLLGQGAEVDCSLLKTGETAYYFACGRDVMMMAHTLKQYGANPRVVCSNGVTPLMYAVFCRSQVMVDYLLDQGHNVDGQNDQGITALMLAVSSGCLVTVRKLVRKQALLEVVDNQGRSALLRAVIFGHLTIVRYLVTHRANLFCCCREGLDALCWASRQGHVEMVSWLLAHPAYSDQYPCFPQAIGAAAIFGHKKVLQVFNVQIMRVMDQKMMAELVQAVLAHGHDRSVLTVLLPLLYQVPETTIQRFLQAAHQDERGGIKYLDAYVRKWRRANQYQTPLRIRGKSATSKNSLSTRGGILCRRIS